MEAEFQAWVRLLRAQRILLDRVEATLKQAGLPPLSWYDVLLELSRDDHSGLRQYEIAERVLLSKHNLTRLLDRLETKGLIVRRECPEDGRGNIVSITAKGRSLQKRMWPVYAQAVGTHFAARLSPKELESLSRILGKVLA